ncbi:MAG: hypothetical protein DMG30_28345 [Acidobacteria bacterium]|nr:MAG: hypothetical protein DMG30_28345 [Acidobacteriota bacterium]
MRYAPKVIDAIEPQEIKGDRPGRGWIRDQTEAKQVIESWRREYNESLPHQCLEDRTQFACQIAFNGDLTSSQTAENSP